MTAGRVVRWESSSWGRVKGKDGGDAQIVKSRERLGSLGQMRLEAVVPSGKGIGGSDVPGEGDVGNQHKGQGWMWDGWL